MVNIDRTARREGSISSIGLNCTANGVSLAGVALLRKTTAGLTPRPMDELRKLMEELYDRKIDLIRVRSGLEVIAQALNRGDLGRAMVAAVQLKLPAMDWKQAVTITNIETSLSKYDPDQPRDDYGRWTSEIGSNSSSSLPYDREKLLLVANRGLPSDDPASVVCNVATRQCQLSALDDKMRSYFDSRWKAQNACELTVLSSRENPYQPFYVSYPDHTVVFIMGGSASITYISGTKLRRPFRFSDIPQKSATNSYPNRNKIGASHGR